MPHGTIGLPLTVTLLAAGAVPAHAQSEWTGGFSDTWFLSENWLGGMPRATSTAIINTLTPHSTVIASPGATARSLDVGPLGQGALVIQSRGTLAILGSSTIGNLPGGFGAVTVTGADTSWSNSGNFVVGGQSTGTLWIEGGATLSSGGASVGLTGTSTGAVTVTGAGSAWFNGPSGGFNIGSFGTGSLTIANGAKVLNLTPPDNPIVANIGNGAGSNGTVTVTGQGSLWNTILGVNIGNRGTGTLTIADGGFVTVAGPVVIGNVAGSSGTLNIGAGAGEPAAAPGTLTAANIGFGAGTGTINFNHTSADYVFAPAISGNGSVNGLAGTTTLTADNTYTGGTMLKGGQIKAGRHTALGSGPLAMDAGATLGFASDGLNLANAVLLTGASDPVIDTGAFTATMSGVISGGGALTKNGGGTLVLAGVNSWAGATMVAAGTLRAGTAGAFSPASIHAVAPGATLDTGGFNQHVAGLANNGTVSLVGAHAGSTLTVAGAYAGSAGSVLKLGTGLPASDRLVIDGAAATASGTTSVQIATLGALGAPTTGDGVEVITARNGATTTAQTTRDAFQLLGGHVDAGAYEYRLHPGDAQGAGENWYLRSTAELPPVGPPNEVVPPDELGPPPIQPVVPPTIPPATPAYRAEVPLLAALPAQLRQADLAMLGNLHRRMGDEAPGAGSGPGAWTSSSLAGEGTRRGWGRVVYADLSVEQPGIALARTDLRVSGFQAGTDLLAMNAWRAGVYVGHLDGNADVSGNARGVSNTAVGSNDLRSRFLGAYATWMDASGWYFDSVLQGASHRYEVRPNGNPSVSGKAAGFTASVEGGKAFALDERWTLEPQAQLAWQHSSFGDLILSGARTQQDSASGWIARLGLRIRGDLATAAGRFQPYGRLNFYRANLGGDSALFIGPAASTVIASESSYSAGEVAAGATLALTSATSLYGEIGHQWNVGGDADVKSSVQGSLGLKVRW